MIWSPTLVKYGALLLGVLMGLGLLAAAHHSVYQKGYDARDTECRATDLLRDQADRDAQDAAVADAQRIELLMGQIAIDQALIAAQQAKKREIQFRDVIKWRTQYEKNPDAGKCVVPDEFVCLLDSTGEDGSGMSEGTGTPCRVANGAGRLSDIELLQYSTDAKMMCLKWRDQLIGWQEREKGLQALEFSSRSSN